MKEIKGIYSSAKVFTDIIDEKAVEQIQTLCNQEFTKDAKIRIMPDAHAGVGCVIGFTANLGELVIPNIVGVDIGCGMLTVDLKDSQIDLEKLDQIIRKYIPSGTSVHSGRIMRFDKLQELYCYRELKDSKRVERSIGTLGGGNHFIEVDVDENNHSYLVIHTGSRNLGKQVAQYYQNLAYDLMAGKDELLLKQEQLISDYKKQGRKDELQEAIKELRKNFIAKEVQLPKELCYLSGKYRDQYLHDMAICQEYATLNRQMIAKIILKQLLDMSLEEFDYFETIHNYIDHDENIMRKGAVSAKLNEKILIPINMRDGSLICLGKGNEEWNQSAPHGAGRLYSRQKAKELFSLNEFEDQMQGIYSTSINQHTLDECPMAYKSMDDIVNNIGETATIIQVIKPIYNFKA
ncbi:MAG: RtcB family protein [Longibaculum muris]|uniref:3'-phosphate/5'-hydroxy nucleic acid ligase n=1 Tax=Longibaculum muris TaxID=1796628 RepID=A0A4R3YYS0_9FIRM|nr:RtcB family protein [Longibaculum muris]MBS5367863.1 RtcB family protein [Coprobacillus cateniformis]MCR1887393.1 RtcB family protein [Longibaculum muris]MED9812487.1 RtcB family protein [Longibaculum muris]TCV97921.1 RNA-splicing ligase RtcB [Longibaculum muris]